MLAANDLKHCLKLEVKIYTNCSKRTDNELKGAQNLFTQKQYREHNP